jgi:hypothetical protein
MVYLARSLLDEAGLQGLFQGCQQALLVNSLAYHPQQLESKVYTNDGCGAQDPVTLLRQPVETVPDDIPDSLGYLNSGRSINSHLR